jgi:hypothetical protein
MYYDIVYHTLSFLKPSLSLALVSKKWNEICKDLLRRGEWTMTIKNDIDDEQLKRICSNVKYNVKKVEIVESIKIEEMARSNKQLDINPLANIAGLKELYINNVLLKEFNDHESYVFILFPSMDKVEFNGCINVNLECFTHINDLNINCCVIQCIDNTSITNLTMSSSYNFLRNDEDFTIYNNDEIILPPFTGHVTIIDIKEEMISINDSLKDKVKFLTTQS